MSLVGGFVEGDIVRTEDPDFELVYQKLPPTSIPIIGRTVVLNASNQIIIAGVGIQNQKIGVRTSLIDRETGNVGILYRGYIVQKAGASTLKVGARVKSDAVGLPLPEAIGGDPSKVYGIVIGKANTDDQTTRVDATTGLLTIIKVGDT